MTRRTDRTPLAIRLFALAIGIAACLIAAVCVAPGAALVPLVAATPLWAVALCD